MNQPTHTTPKPNFFVLLLGSGLYTGFSPFASGTVGSLLALLIYWFIPVFQIWYVLAFAVLVSTLVGIPIATSLEKTYGDDPSVVVLDEIAGMWLSLLFLPVTWYYALAAFFLFRIFDIIKPPPARQFDNMHGGFGIMMDDIAAAVYANILLQVVRYFI